MSEAVVVLRLPDGDVPIPGGKVTVLSRGRPTWTGEVVRCNMRTVTVRVYNRDRTWWEGLFKPSRLRALLSPVEPDRVPLSTLRPADLLDPEPLAPLPKPLSRPSSLMKEPTT